MSAADIRVSGTVTGRRLRIRRPTGTSYCSDTPRSPRTARESHSPYWTRIGRFSPSASRSRAAASGLPSGPMITRAGSPGRTRTTTNTRTETTKRVATNAATLLAMYRRTPGLASRLLGPPDLGEVEHPGAARQVLPEPLQALLRHGEPGVDVEPHDGRVLHQLLLHLHVELAARLVVHGDLRLLVELLEVGAVVAEVVLRVGIVADVPRLGMTDDRQIVVGVLPHAREPLAPLDLLDLDLHADLLELVGQDLTGAHGVVVLRRDLQHGVESVRVAGLGEELLGLRGVVRHRARHVDEVRIERIDVGPEHAAKTEHRALHRLRLVDPVGDGATHPHVGERFPRVVHRQDDVVRRLTDDHLEARVLLQIRH